MENPSPRPSEAFEAGLEVSSPPLVSQRPTQSRSQQSKWLYRGLLGILFFAVVGVSLVRLNEPKVVQEPVIVAASTDPLPARPSGQEPAPATVAAPVPAPPPAPIAAPVRPPAPVTAPVPAPPTQLAKAPTPAPSALAQARTQPDSQPAFRPSASLPLPRQVEASLREWVRLWAAQKPDPYLALFDPSFAGWETYSANRRKRMLAATFIEVDIHDLQIRQTAPNEITTRFVQLYRSDTHRSKDTKELVWRQTASGPKIFAERLVK
jgi:hypothetical protein